MARQGHEVRQLLSARIARVKPILELVGNLAGPPELLNERGIRFLGTFSELVGALEVLRQLVFERSGLHDEFLHPRSTSSRHLSAPQSLAFIHMGYKIRAARKLEGSGDPLSSEESARTRSSASRRQHRVEAVQQVEYVGDQQSQSVGAHVEPRRPGARA